MNVCSKFKILTNEYSMLNKIYKQMNKHTMEL
jgi:hypothetical protein